MYFCRINFGYVCAQTQEMIYVGLIMEQFSSTKAAIDDMVPCAWITNSQWSGHA